jgi:hypothetical protein
LPKHFLAGLSYSTNSTLAPRFPNEWEAFARWAPLSEDYGAPADVGGQIGYNNAAEGIDGEVSLARRLGIARSLSPAEPSPIHSAKATGGTLLPAQPLSDWVLTSLLPAMSRHSTTATRPKR